MPQRNSVAVMYLAVADAPRRVVQLPAAHAELLERIYARLGLARELGDGAAPAFDQRAQLDLSVRADHDTAFLRARAFGADWVARVAARVEELEQRAIDAIYLDLPLGDGRAAASEPALHELGFRFGCLLPELHGGDVLRLQRLGSFELDPARVATASDFGRELLESSSGGL